MLEQFIARTWLLKCINYIGFNNIYYVAVSEVFFFFLSKILKVTISQRVRSTAPGRLHPKASFLKGSLSSHNEQSIHYLLPLIFNWSWSKRLSERWRSVAQVERWACIVSLSYYSQRSYFVLRSFIFICDSFHKLNRHLPWAMTPICSWCEKKWYDILMLSYITLLGIITFKKFP